MHEHYRGAIGQSPSTVKSGVADGATTRIQMGVRRAQLGVLAVAAGQRVRSGQVPPPSRGTFLDCSCGLAVAAHGGLLVFVAAAHLRGKSKPTVRIEGLMPDRRESTLLLRSRVNGSSFPNVDESHLRPRSSPVPRRFPPYETTCPFPAWVH